MERNHLKKVLLLQFCRRSRTPDTPCVLQVMESSASPDGPHRLKRSEDTQSAGLDAEDEAKVTSFIRVLRIYVNGVQNNFPHFSFDCRTLLERMAFSASSDFGNLTDVNRVLKEVIVDFLGDNSHLGLDCMPILNSLTYKKIDN